MLYALPIVVCFDAKINFDDNAKFRQQDLFASEDIAEKNPREVEAEKYNLNYIGMDGNIACIGKIVSLLYITIGDPKNKIACLVLYTVCTWCELKSSLINIILQMIHLIHAHNKLT